MVKTLTFIKKVCGIHVKLAICPLGVCWSFLLYQFTIHIFNRDNLITDGGLRAFSEPERIWDSS